jgi:hypothetical protein
MTERPPTINGSAGVLPLNAALSESPFPFSINPTTHPDVPQALLTRPSAKSHATHRGDDTPFPAIRPICERTANRLARLTRSREARPTFLAHSLKDSTRPAAFSAALACPDAFLMDAPCGPNRVGLAVDFVEEAVAAGQRILVLASENCADTLTVRFSERGFRLALCTNLKEISDDATPHLERRIAERERAEECLRLEALVNTESAELDRLDALARKAAEYDERAAGLQRELAELHQHAAVPASGLGGFVKKLFGGAKAPTDLPARIASLEEQLRNLVASERVTPEHRDRVATAHRDADAAFARAIAKPLEIAAETVAAFQVIVATFDAFESSRLLNDDAPKFDRLLIVDGEDLEEDDFLTAAARAEAWVLFGNPEADGFFTYLWMNLHASPWQTEQERLIARLAPLPYSSVEPLFDRPEIELRFAGETLAEVAFPLGTTLAEAKRFLSNELGEVKLTFPGTGVWNEAEELIAYECPGLAGATIVDLGEGITEMLSAGDADAFTGRIVFCKSKWNRVTAEEWLNARLLPQVRTASMPKPLFV